MKISRVLSAFIALAVIVLMGSCTKEVTGVSLNKTAIELVEGAEENLTVTVTPEDASDKSIEWISSDTKVATVNGGRVMAMAPGRATITATNKSSGKSASCMVTVVAKYIPVTNVSLDKSSATIAKGSEFVLTATIAPSNATNKNLVWSSSDESVATVDANGKVKGVKSGSAAITVMSAADNSKKAECAITVKTYVESVSIQAISETEIRVGQSLTLTATVAPADADDKSVTWESSNASVISVSADGTLKGVGEGSATITVTTSDGGKKATVTLTCRGYCNVIVYDPVTGEIKW